MTVMKLLLTHRFFWPDTAPYAVMLRAIAADLAEAGHEVHVFASVPSYRDGANTRLRREVIDGAKVHRVRVFLSEKANIIKRLSNVLIYTVALFFEVLRLRPDIVTAATYPPVVAAWGASLAARLTGARFVYHLQDIYPEISETNADRLGHGLPARLMRWLDNQTLRRAAAIVVLSEDMAHTLAARGLGPLPIHVLNNFSLTPVNPVPIGVPAGLAKPIGTRRVIFAGNLGRFQNLSLLTQGVARLFSSHPNLELLLLGDGVALPDLKAQWADNPQVRFAPFLPFEVAREVIAEADIGLVSLAPGIYRAAYPSKVLTYLELGVPILALVETESQLAASLVEAGIGAVPTTATPEAIATALEDLLASAPPTETVRGWYETNASRSTALMKWRLLINDLEGVGNG